MDENVIAAMARWPNVPDVFGWLSLNAGGHWRLHTAGDALETDTGTPREGVSISSSSINNFINRNYASDSKGRWYFQNGPQRVYVRLDVAPYVLHTVDARPDHPAFLTHNGVRADATTRWCLDDAGHVYADTGQGAGLVAGRDLEHILHGLATAGGDSLMDALQNVSFDGVSSIDVRWGEGASVPFHVCRFSQVPDLLGFVRYPRPDC